MPATAKLSDDLVGEIFLRLPPDDPACLLRASLVCKHWRRILADPDFRRRHGALHRTPPVVGFIGMVNGAVPFASCFVPNSPASGRPVARELPDWLMLDCRHGRALFATPTPSPGTHLTYGLVVWDPLTNEQQLLPSPLATDFPGNCAAALLCAATAEGCDHRACHKGPFLVVFIWSHRPGLFLRGVTSAGVYSSVTGEWSQSISVQHPDDVSIEAMLCPTTLVGDKLYFSCAIVPYAFEYVLGAHRLSIIELPLPSLFNSMFYNLMSMEDGLVCIGVEEEPTLCLRLWSRVLAPENDGVESWERGRAIELDTLLPKGALPAQRLPSNPSSVLWAYVVGFAEGTDVVFVGTNTSDNRGAVYMVQLNSRRARKVFEKCTEVFPYTSFCIPECYNFNWQYSRKNFSRLVSCTKTGRVRDSPRGEDGEARVAMESGKVKPDMHMPDGGGVGDRAQATC